MSATENNTEYNTGGGANVGQDINAIIGFFIYRPSVLNPWFNPIQEAIPALSRTASPSPQREKPIIEKVMIPRGTSLIGDNGVANSAPTFKIELPELWYLLHFNYHDTAIGREKYKAKLTDNLGKTYFKNDPTIYNTLKAKIKTAMQHAKRLLAQYELPNPAADNPSTTVYLLVEQLLRFSR